MQINDLPKEIIIKILLINGNSHCHSTYLEVCSYWSEIIIKNIPLKQLYETRTIIFENDYLRAFKTLIDKDILIPRQDASLFLGKFFEFKSLKCLKWFFSELHIPTCIDTQCITFFFKIKSWKSILNYLISKKFHYLHESTWWSIVEMLYERNDLEFIKKILNNINFFDDKSILKFINFGNVGNDCFPFIYEKFKNTYTHNLHYIYRCISVNNFYGFKFLLKKTNLEELKPLLIYCCKDCRINNNFCDIILKFKKIRLKLDELDNITSHLLKTYSIGLFCIKELYTKLKWIHNRFNYSMNLNLSYFRVKQMQLYFKKKVHLLI